ncbi:hypothetical protein BJY04DRAFT_217819 [Aspergillus karnatakaensis]|uniref:uncharacterized protein n=1 Tax=Aspergillus karnatakaensis TaxID=1810916 RepID=UPI003CCD5F6D
MPPRRRQRRPPPQTPLLTLLWQGIVDPVNGNPRYQAPHILFLILDQLKDRELIKLIAGIPAMTGCVFWVYGVRYRWRDALYTLPNPAILVEWHSMRHAVWQREMRIATLQLMRWQARNQGDNVRVRDIEQRIREAHLNQLRDEHHWLTNRVLPEIQAIQTAVPLAGPVAAVPAAMLAAVATAALAATAALNAGGGGAAAPAPVPAPPAPPAPAAAPAPPAAPAAAGPPPPPQLMQAWYQVHRGEVIPQITIWANSVQQRIQTLQTEIQNNTPPGPPILGDIPPLTLPIPTAQITQSIRGRFEPIEELIALDAVEPLRLLETMGLFTRTGYTRMGYTYLHHAALRRARKVGRWILNGLDWTFLGRETAFRHVVAHPMNNNHLAILAQSRWEHEFYYAWNQAKAHNPAVLATSVIHPVVRPILSSFINHATAIDLLAHGLNVATVTLYDPYPWSPWTDDGSVWHQAANNPNVDFLDFLYTHLRGPMEKADDNSKVPLALAVDLKNFAVARRLVELGHRWRPSAALYFLDHPDLSPDDNGFQFFHSVLDRRKTAEKWLYMILLNLQRNLFAGVHSRAKLLRDAGRLLRVMNVGNGRVRPRMTARHVRRMVRNGTPGNLTVTPEEYARFLGFGSLAIHLQKLDRRGGAGGRGRNTRYNLR